MSGLPEKPGEKGNVPPWVWVVVSVLVMGLLGAGGCLIGVGILASRGAGAKPATSSSPVTTSSEGDFVMVEADRTQAPEDVFRAAAVTASARGLTPFVYATASWCEPCKQLNRSMSDARMKDAFKGTYVVKLDVDAFGGRLAGVGLRVRAVPSFYELGADGMPTGRNLIGDWGPDTPENMAPALKRFFAVTPR